MKGRIWLLILLMGFCVTTKAQQTDTLVKKLDSLEKRNDTTKQTNNIKQTRYNDSTKITLKNYFVLLADDFKQQVTSPFHLKKKEWLYLGLFAGGIAALTTVDEPIQRNALSIRNANPGLANLSGYVTDFGAMYEVYTLAGLGAYGFLFKNEKVKTTTYLATQSYITAGVWMYVFKTLSGRQRPTYYDPNATEPEPKFHGPFQTGKDAFGNKLNSSFPSGHTAAAFSAATVYAMEYRDRPLVPIIAYSAASLIGLSRITENKHWLTDVIAGAALGYFCGRQVVNNYHRYAKVKSPAKKTSMQWNLKYVDGAGIQPGLVYHF